MPRSSGLDGPSAGDLRDQLNESRECTGFATAECRTDSPAAQPLQGRDEFLGLLAHELRNQLAPLTNALEIMRLSDDFGPSADALRNIMETQVRQLLRLVENLLDHSRIARGSFELHKADVCLSNVVETAVKTCQPQIDAARHELSVELPREPVRLQADPERLSKAISNLLDNAAKFTSGSGHIRLSAKLEGAELIIRVEDNGEGIPPQLLPEVFDAYARPQQLRERSHQGLGLGLAVSRGLVELHGGQLDASSAGPGCGACFTVRLPNTRPSAATEERVDQDGRSELPPRRRIVIVDDTRASAHTLATLLESLQQDVFVTHDPNLALELIATKRPHIVISDIAMPGMDGYELAARIRNSDRADEIRLVALSGYGRDDDRQKTAAAGFDLHLVKPVSFDALRELLRSITDSEGTDKRG